MWYRSRCPVWLVRSSAVAVTCYRKTVTQALWARSLMQYSSADHRVCRSSHVLSSTLESHTICGIALCWYWNSLLPRQVHCLGHGVLYRRLPPRQRNTTLMLHRYHLQYVFVIDFLDLGPVSHFLFSCFGWYTKVNSASYLAGVGRWSIGSPAWLLGLGWGRFTYVGCRVTVHDLIW